MINIINTREKVFINCKFNRNYYGLLSSTLPYIDTCNGLHYSSSSPIFHSPFTLSPPSISLRDTSLFTEKLRRRIVEKGMVTDVTFLYSVMNQQQTMMNDSKSTALITRDLLGGGGGGGCELDSSKELDLDLHVPSGYEKRLDLKVNFWPISALIDVIASIWSYDTFCLINHWLFVFTYVDFTKFVV